MVADVVEEFIQLVSTLQATLSGAHRQIHLGFFQITQAQQTQQATAPYRFGPDGIKFEDIVLLGLRRVSVASFQPILAYRPLPSYERTGWIGTSGCPLYSTTDQKTSSVRPFQCCWQIRWVSLSEVPSIHCIL